MFVWYKDTKKQFKRKPKLFATSSCLSHNIQFYFIFWHLFVLGKAGNQYHILRMKYKQLNKRLELHIERSLIVNELLYARDLSSSPHKQNLTI